MKKFHFYLVDVEPDDIRDECDISYYVGRGWFVRSKKAAELRNTSITKITVWLSQKPLKGICKAPIHGWVELLDWDECTLKYSHKSVLKALAEGKCGSWIRGNENIVTGIWFARAKVEKV